MTEYVLEIINDLLRPPPPYDCAGSAEKLYIKIDKNGNVEIKAQGISICSGHPNQYYEIRDVLIINDNIPIPNYIINMLKVLLPSTSCNYTGLYRQHYHNVIESIKIIKRELEELCCNPQNITDIKMKLEYSITENNILKKEIKNMKSKIKNIQTSYFDILNDNEKLKKENIELLEYISELKHKKNSMPKKNCIHDNNTPSNNLSNCWNNPGGATIYTKSNASNRMVYNETSGIYEPDENN